MLSVINRGTVSGGETGGLAYKIINGYSTHTSIIKLNNIPSPLEINIDPIIKNGHSSAVLPVTLGGIDIVNVPVNPIIKNGYTPVNVEIEVN